MRRPWLVLLVLLALPLARAGAGEPWAEEQAYKDLVKQETKALRGLLQAAQKKDYRRQAWYFADRLLQLDPTDAKAQAVVDGWTAEALQVGQVPKPAFEKQRNAALRELGDAYFRFGETLDASGMAPETYFPINVRAHAYGSQAGPLLAALEQAGFVWLGVYGAKEKAEVEKLLGGAWGGFAFPQEYDDDYLKARCVWPEARGARTGDWRLLTDHDYQEALRLLGMLRALEAWMLETFGGKDKDQADQVTDVLVFSEWQTYDKVGRDLVNEREKDKFPNTSGWYDPWDDRLLVCWRHRDNPFLGDDDLLLGHASKVVARRHLAGGARGRLDGKGFWLLEGLRGACEGFHLDADGHGEIDAGACWRLAAARALRGQGMLRPWKEFLELDRPAAEALDRPTLKITFGGSERDAKRVDTVAAQATALVVGLLKADRGTWVKKLAKLIGDVYKRDSLPDLGKALGLKPDKLFALAETAMDAADGK